MQKQLTEIDFRTFKVAGVSYRPASVIDPLQSGDEIRLVPEPTNEFDQFAIKIEAKFIYEGGNEDGSDQETWEHIGYVPKNETWYFHVMRKVGIPLKLRMVVNHDAKPQDMLMVLTSFMGDPDAPFLKGE